MSSMTSSPHQTPYCFRCQYTPLPDEAPLQRCARCRSRHYCSRTCQTNDWPKHKRECGPLSRGEQVPTRTRTTMRIGLSSLGQMSNITGNNNSGNNDIHEGSSLDAADTIYYLRTCQPHINDISLSGPYASLLLLADQIAFRLISGESEVGMKMLEELTSSGSIANMHHFNAPMPDGTIFRFEIERETNAEVKAALPCPVYYVVSATPMLGVVRSNEHPRLSWPTEKMEPICTCLTKAAALEKWMEAAREVQGEMPGSRVEVVDEYTDERTLKVALVIPRRREGKARIVQLRYDDCQIQPAEL